MNFKKIMAGAVASIVAATSFAVVADAADDGVNFKAGLIYQTNAWTFRNNINQSKALWRDPDFDDEMEYDVWNFGDVDITGDGTYMVYFEKNIMEDCKDGPEVSWNHLKLQTNIPYADYNETVTIDVDKLVIDGVEIADAKNAIVTEDSLFVDDYSDIEGVAEHNMKVLTVGFVNAWNTDQNVIDSTSTFGGRVMLVFTISGLGGEGGNYTEGDEPEWETAGGSDKPDESKEPDESKGPEESSTTTAAPADGGSDNSALPFIIGGIAAAVVVVVIVIVVVAKKKK